MSWMSRLGLKALTRMRFPGRTWVFLDSPRPTDRKIKEDVGDGTAANVVMTPVRWMQRAFAEAPLIVDEDGEKLEEHALAQLVAQPNAFYSGDHLFAATLLSLALDGNAYWLKIRNGRRRVIELWYVPHDMIEPKWPDDGQAFISHYEYTPGGRRVPLEVDDVVHFRDGLDPQNIRKGLAPLKGLFREIWTDMEAANLVSALMKNGGVPGLVISPDTDQQVDGDEAEAVKQHVENNFTREGRGRTLVMKGKTKVEQFGFSPQQLDLSALRNLSEERVTAALGVPAAIIGFGTGIEQTKVGATMKELRKLAWHNGIIPMQRLIEQEVNRSLLRDFEGSARNRRARFDNDDVQALQEDETERVQRIARLVEAAVWTRAEAREETGKDATAADQVYLQGFNVVERRQGRAEPPPTGNEPPQQRGLKHQHTLTEERIAREAPEVRRPPQQLIELATQLDRLRRMLPADMEDELEQFFSELGRDVEVAAEPFVKQRESIEAEQILEGLNMAERLPIFGAIYERAYLRVTSEVDRTLSEMMDVAVGLPDPHARAVVAAGGTRAGLVDLEAQTRRAIFDRLTEGRAEGMAGENLARFIRERVESGPWTSPTIRARVISRTETNFAVNKASIEKMKSIEGVERAMIFDNRTGFGDAVCTAMNQRVVTLEEAEQLVADEHPNGTRSFAPMSPALMEEMGLEV